MKFQEDGFKIVLCFLSCVVCDTFTRIGLFPGSFVSEEDRIKAKEDQREKVVESKFQCFAIFPPFARATVKFVSLRKQLAEAKQNIPFILQAKCLSFVTNITCRRKREKD